MQLGQFMRDGAGRGAQEISLKRFGSSESRALQGPGRGRGVGRISGAQEGGQRQREMKNPSAGQKAGGDLPWFANLLAWFGSISRAQTQALLKGKS